MPSAEEDANCFGSVPLYYPQKKKKKNQINANIEKIKQKLQKNKITF